MITGRGEGDEVSVVKSCETKNVRERGSKCGVRATFKYGEKKAGA